MRHMIRLIFVVVVSVWHISDPPDGFLDNLAKVGLVLGHGDQLGLHLGSDCLQQYHCILIQHTEVGLPEPEP